MESENSSLPWGIPAVMEGVETITVAGNVRHQGQTTHPVALSTNNQLSEIMLVNELSCSIHYRSILCH